MVFDLRKPVDVILPKVQGDHQLESSLVMNCNHEGAFGCTCGGRKVPPDLESELESEVGPGRAARLRSPAGRRHPTPAHPTGVRPGARLTRQNGRSNVEPLGEERATALHQILEVKRSIRCKSRS